jgi:NADH:ubiquinone oxidoreductase subunit 5 (subunit L)/multisubunit Na+/H+ antiporter MnhA subunit
VAAAGLGLTGGLALACFAKLHGTVFLGTRRNGAEPPAPRGDRGLIGSQMVLVAACLAIGLIPTAVVPIVARIASGFVGPVDPAVTGIGPAALRLSVGSLGAVALGLLIWVAASRAVRRQARTSTWSCGYAPLTARMQYTASSFASPLLTSFRALVPVRQERGPATFHLTPLDPVLDVIGDWLWRGTRGAASHLRFLQTGRLRWYLLYLIVTLLLLLTYLRVIGVR